MSFHPFSAKVFVINIQLSTILEVFPICYFTICKKPQKEFGWEYKKDMDMSSPVQGPVLYYYDYWPILGQSTRNLIIEGAMFNQDTPWKNIFFISSKDVMVIKKSDIFKFSFVKSHKHLFHLVYIN